MNNVELFKKAVEKGLKVGYVDIETSPILAWTYPLFKANIMHDAIELDTKITSIVTKKEGEKECKVYEWEDARGKLLKGKNQELLKMFYMDDRKMLSSISADLNKFDIIIAQNGDNFDVKIIQWRLNQLNLPPLENIVTLDTLKLSRKSFRPSSHKLDYRSLVYKLGGKIKQDMQACISVAKGDAKTQVARIKYNIKDVNDLQKIFWKELNYYNFPAKILRILRQYVKLEKNFCIKCAHRHQRRYDITKTRSGFKCQQCGYSWV